jgi:hypothetical protein
MLEVTIIICSEPVLSIVESSFILYSHSMTSLHITQPLFIFVQLLVSEVFYN